MKSGHMTCHWCKAAIWMGMMGDTRFGTTQTLDMWRVRTVADPNFLTERKGRDRLSAERIFESRHVACVLKIEDFSDFWFVDGGRTVPISLSLGSYCLQTWWPHPFCSHKLQSGIARVPERQQNKKQKDRASNVPHWNGALRFSDKCFCNTCIPHSLMNRLRVLNLVLLDIRVSSQSTATGYPDVPPVHRSTNKCYLSLRVHKLVRLSIKELVRFVHRHVSCTSCNSFRVNLVPMCLWVSIPDRASPTSWTWST